LQNAKTSFTLKSLNKQQMETIKSDEFRKIGEQAEETLKNAEGLDSEYEQELVLMVKRNEVKNKVQAALGVDFDIIIKHENAHVAGCADIDQNKGYIALTSLDDVEKAKHIARHESIHLETKISDLPIENDMSKDHVKSMKKALNISDDDVNLVEGFTEMLTAEKEGKMASCTYNQKEVPAAEKLENLCKQFTGYSLKEAFLSGKKTLFKYRMRKLADFLLCRDALTQFSREKAGLSSTRLIQDVEDKMKQEIPVVKNHQDALQTVKKLYLEEQQKSQIRLKLAA
jgi:hypothetical protein